tara:strand:+ start:530 stop:2491 length:1962 start_codon:yes stop_codon:yes gene_type:complete
MGNALEAAKFSILQGNTGVDDKSTLIKGIDDFAGDVKTWKDNIDAARLKLKTDTASKYREAEKEVYENLPSDKTDRDLALKALASYKDQLYGNMGLVQAGMIKPEDNLIFQENGKQSFEILANQINDYAKRREETLKRSKGYYETNEDGSQKLDAQGKPIYVPPASGAYEASLQDLQSRMGNPEFTNVTFGENGMAKVTFYKTEIDELTGTRVLIKDADGNPIPIDGLKDMSVLSFDRGRNQRADRLDLQTNVMNVVGPNTALGQTFDTMSKNGLLLGTIEDNQRANPQLKAMIDDGVSTLTSTPDRIVSILSDNGPQSQQSIPLNVAQWDGLTDAQKKETVTYTWTDASGNQQTGTKSKYIKLVTSANGQIVPELEPKDREAAENIARTSVYAALKKDITDKGTKRSEFQKKDPKPGDDKKDSTFKLIDQVVGTGNRDSLEAIVRENPNVVNFEINKADPADEGSVDEVIFTKADGTKTAPIPLGKDRDAVDVGKLFAAELGYPAEAYANKSDYKAGDPLSQDIKDFENFETPKESYGGLGKLAIGKDGNDITYASQYIEKDDEGEMAAKAQVVVDKARARYGDIPNIKVSFDDLSNMDGTDEISITIDGVKYKNVGYTSDNHKWLMENLDRALSGEQIQGTSSSGVIYKDK